MTPEQIAELERLERGATPGEWAWFGNTGNHDMHLATVHSGRVFVMKFRRWGMSGAQPYFQDREHHLIRPATDFVRFERDYRKDIAAIEHPDAKLIPAARNALPSLLQSARDLASLRAAVRALAGEVRGMAGRAGCMLCDGGEDRLIDVAESLEALLPGGDDASREGTP